MIVVLPAAAWPKLYEATGKAVLASPTLRKLQGARADQRRAGVGIAAAQGEHARADLRQAAVGGAAETGIVNQRLVDSNIVAVGVEDGTAGLDNRIRDAEEVG